MGADVITGGNHSFRRPEIFDLYEQNPFILRPHNLKTAEFGSGYCLFDMGRCSVAVINLSGKVYLDKNEAENPFLTADKLIEKAKSDGAKIILVDFHAEATSEKRALGFYLDGRASALWGTHTHVQTADCQILPGGSAYTTDIGMTGPKQSVLGVKSDIIIDRFVGLSQTKFELAEGACMLNGCVIDIDDATGLARDIFNIYAE